MTMEQRKGVVNECGRFVDSLNTHTVMNNLMCSLFFFSVVKQIFSYVYCKL